MAENGSQNENSEQQIAGWNQLCLEEHFAEIATSIVNWREIAPFLGLTEAEDHEILASAPHSIFEQKMKMLRLWKNKNRNAATYEQLCQVFRTCNLFQLEHKIIEILMRSNS